MTHTYISVCTLEAGGVSPTGKSDFGFGSCRECERARRGEAVWASERRFDCAARAVVRRFSVRCGGESMPGVHGLSTKNLDLTLVL